jgi:hypothetical protein
MISWGSASTSAHAAPTSFGMQPIIIKFIQPAIEAIADAADRIDAGLDPSTARCAAPSCKASLRAGFVSGPTNLFKGCTRPAAQIAFELGLQPVAGVDEVGITDWTGGYEPMVSICGTTGSIEAMIDVLRPFQEAQVDVLFIITYPRECTTALAALEQMDYAPKSVACALTVQTAEYSQAIDAGAWIQEYVLGPVVWDKSITSYGQFSQLTSAEFGAIYEERFKEPSSHLPAAAYTALCALGHAVETAGSLETAAVTAALNDMNLQEFFTTVTFDGNGQITSDRAFATVQYAPGATSLAVVHPPSLVSTGVMAFPTPTWAQRRCQIKGPGQSGATLSEDERDAWHSGTTVECSGNGACSEDGECVCGEGYAGLRCQQQAKTVPQSMAARAQALVASQNCRTELLSTESNCNLTPFNCGATCTDSAPRTSLTENVVFDGESAQLDHFSMSEFTTTALSCVNGAEVEITFAELSENSGQDGGGAAVSVSASTLNISFCKITRNINTGDGAILAEEQSVLGVTHVDFFQNELQNDVVLSNSGSALTCVASVAVVEHSRFAENRGVPIAVSAASVLSISHSAIHGNVACLDASGSSCSFSAGIFISGASDADISSSLFFDNLGASAGAIVATGQTTDVAATGCTFHSNRGVSVETASGAVMAAASATISVRGCSFDSNLGTAPTAAGAIMALDAGLSVIESELRLNQIQGNPGTTAGAGGVYAERSSIDLIDSDLVDNGAVDEPGNHASTVAFGKDFYAVSPTRSFVFGTSFHPFDDALSALIVPGISRGIMRGSCEEYPCQPGFKCSYTNVSLSCTPCSLTTYSSTGIDCTMCSAGQGPNLEHTGCQQCGGNNHSEFGVCEPCPAGLVTDTDNVRCDECGVHRTAVATASQTRSICSCTQGYYNQSDSVHVCFRDGYSTSHEQEVLGRRQNAQASTGQSCATCAKDTEDEECVTCTVGSLPVLRAGYTAVQLSSSRRQLQSHDSNLAVSFIFRCHHDLEIAALRCPGGDIEASCAEGYEGYTCGSCVDGYGMSADKECLLCEANEITVGGVLLLVVVLLAFALILAIVGKYWMRFPWRHVLRCAAQPTRILITYTQVTSQLGDVRRLKASILCTCRSSSLISPHLSCESCATPLAYGHEPTFKALLARAAAQH